MLLEQTQFHHQQSDVDQATPHQDKDFIISVYENKFNELNEEKIQFEKDIAALESLFLVEEYELGYFS